MDNFDYNFYINYYYDLHNFDFINALNHYNNFGKKEGRVCNSKQILNNINFYKKIINTYNELTFIKEEEKLINICIRTCNRPNYFETCIQSIFNQNYKNYKILVSYDSHECLKYLKKYDIEYFYPNVKSDEKYKFNLYCNLLMDKIKNGFVLFLDDDDCLTHPNCFKIMNENIESDNDLLIWKFLKPDKCIYPNDIKNIKLGQIDSTSFTFNINQKKEAYWDDKQCSDFRFFQRLINNKLFKIKIINYILVKTINEFKGVNLGHKNILY